MTAVSADGAGRVAIGGIAIDPVTEAGVVSSVRQGWADGRGGTIIPVNIDVARTVSREPGLVRLVAEGSLVVADGMPLLWAARAGGMRLPERVTGSSLVFSLSAAAAADRRRPGYTGPGC